MRSTSWLFILTSVLCARVAFAADRATVDIPFSFESHGRIFPASRYDVTLKDNSFLTLTSRTNPSDTISWTPVSAGMDPKDPLLSMKFDQVGNTHELHSVRLGKYQTLVLDTHFDQRRNPGPAQSGQ
jgi:hypothetical protein